MRRKRYYRVGSKWRPTKCYGCWRGILSRCISTSHKSYKNYGGRGIGICQEWLDYDVFADWCEASGMAKGLQIDRIDNDGNYEPGNCRWTTQKVQNNNRRTVKWIEFNGLRLTQRDWSKRIGITEGGLWHRLKHWPVEKALTLPRQSGKKM